MEKRQDQILEEIEIDKTQEDELENTETKDSSEKSIAESLLKSNENFASTVINQSRQQAKKNAINFGIAVFIWLITFIALVGTNAYWIYVFQSYDYYSQDGSGINSINTGDQEGITYESGSTLEEEWTE